MSELLIVIIGGCFILMLFFATNGMMDKKFEKKLKDKNPSMPDMSLLFGKKKRK